MPLLPGSKLGPYEIIELIGAGGMGEVHKARDTRLNRIVAIKKGLPAFNERFEREAHAIASLNHPHICSLFDVGPDYLVMEYVDGKPLTGPLPLDEALVLARQILDAIDAAHRKGIVHRDLKPANILVTKSGVKLLDFGLAKPSAELAANLTTFGGPATGAGAIVGTLQYMAPEQIEARDADARSDIFSFGLVFYELLTGKRAFDGASSGSIIASILKDQPQPISELSPSTPKGIDRVVRTCLEKDPEKRWQSAREVRHALDWVEGDATVPRDEGRGTNASSHSSRLWQGASIAALVAAAGAVFWATRPVPPPPAESVRFHIAPPPETTFETYVSLSPDGRHVAFSASGTDGTTRLWVRDLTSVEARALPGTEGAQSIIWSPDSRHIAFGFNNKLKKIAVAGGPPEIVCETESPVGSGAWNSEGTIIFGSRGAGGIERVAAAGGAPTHLTLTPSGGVSSFPSFLSDGRRFIYFRRGPVQGIFVGSIDEKPENQPATPLFVSDLAAAYARASTGDAGYMFFVRDQTLMVQAFDDRTLAFGGDPVPIDRIASVNNYPVFSVSTTGRLAYRIGAQSTAFQLTWFDRSGKPLGTVGDPGAHEQLALSPDGVRAAYRDGLGTVAADIWIADLTRGVSERFTFDRALGGFPVWSPDGSRIVFRAGTDLFQKQSSGGGDAELLLKSPLQGNPSSWSRDGRFLLFTVISANTTLQDIHVLAIESRRALPLIQTQYSETQGTFSPDGRWVAYTSNESGRNEVYVRSFTPPGDATPAAGARWKVSKDGGNGPVWRDDGRELVFRSTSSGSPMAVDIVLTATDVRVGAPRQLFSTPSSRWAMTGDGKRFIVSMPPPRFVQPPITVDLNWEAALKK